MSNINIVSEVKLICLSNQSSRRASDTNTNPGRIIERKSKSDSNLAELVNNNTANKSFKILNTRPTTATMNSSHHLLSSSVSVPIVGYEVMEERERFTVYKLRIENSLTKDCWLVLRRYTDFVRLNNKLKVTYPQIPLQLPKKKIFGDNFSNDFLENRKHGLQIFINSILNNSVLKDSEIIKEFFCIDEPPTYSDNLEECKSIFEAQEETISHLKYQLENLQGKLLHETQVKNRLALVLNKLKTDHPNLSDEIDLAINYM